MQLFASSTSPYTRKVRIVALEHGLEDRLELVTVSPFADPPSLLEAGAVGKVPVLVDGERVVHDSRVICEYLDAMGAGPSLLPEGEARWDDRTRVSSADAVMDAALAVVLERRRAAHERSEAWIARQLARIERVVRSLAPGDGGRPTLGDIAVGCALSYLELRLAELDWRSWNAPLARWTEALEARASFAATRLG